MLSTFLKLLAEKRAEVTTAKKRLESGLDKLTSTAKQVEDMQKELQELQPVLAATAKDVEEMMLVIAHDKEEAAQTKHTVEQQEREANQQAAVAKSIAGGQVMTGWALQFPQAHMVQCPAFAYVVHNSKASHPCSTPSCTTDSRANCKACMLACKPPSNHSIVLLCADDAQRELDAALPALDAALASLKNLSRNDIVEVKSLQNPPAGVKLVMEAACIMFDEKPRMKDDPNKMGERLCSCRAPCCMLHSDLNSLP